MTRSGSARRPQPSRATALSLARWLMLWWLVAIGLAALSLSPQPV